jgi:hypothetical protein
MRKYIRLYEEYTDLEKKSLEKHYSWPDIRNTIQSKLPFIIIDFKDEEAREECIDKDLYDENYVEQKFHLMRTDGDHIKYPSVFIFAKGSDLTKRVLDLNKRFDILRIVIGEFGTDVPSLYVDGDQVDIGGNLLTSNDIEDMDIEDFYSIDAKYYKFIG